MLTHILSFLLLFIGRPIMSVVNGVELPEGFTTPIGFDVHNYTGTALDMFTLKPEIETDIPQAAIDEALNLDVGKFSTISFHYFNHQNDYKVHDRPDLGRCFDDHLKCLLSQTHSAPVCGYNHYHINYGYYTLPSYCYVYFDNCRRGMRYWYIVREGPCVWRDTDNYYCRDFVNSYASC